MSHYSSRGIGVTATRCGLPAQFRQRGPSLPKPRSWDAASRGCTRHDAGRRDAAVAVDVGCIHDKSLHRLLERSDSRVTHSYSTTS
eukprot:355521-Chlamydomonas_euryale.AAC.10